MGPKVKQYLGGEIGRKLILSLELNNACQFTFPINVFSTLTLLFFK